MMSIVPKPTVIADTSPLLYLHQVGCLNLLHQLYTEIVVPTAVAQELAIGHTQGVDVPNVSGLPWIDIPSATPSLSLPSQIDLGQGEAAVILLGLSTANSLLILDDQLGRSIANLYRLKCTGTLGVLIKAKQSGYLSAIAPVIAGLKNQGMWLSDTIIRAALHLAGEAD